MYLKNEIIINLFSKKIIIEYLVVPAREQNDLSSYCGVCMLACFLFACLLAY